MANERSLAICQYIKTFSILACSILFLTTSFYPQQINYSAPAASKEAVREVKFNKAREVDKDYRKQFEICDNQDIFNGIPVSSLRKCSNDKNNLKALLVFPDGTIFFESKLSLDLDGSWKACCGSPGRADQCPTSYRWKPESNKSGCPAFKDEVNVDAEKYPFIVIPQGNTFAQKTGLKTGDLGMAIYKGISIPVFVADQGPENKIGEGSEALFKAFGKSRCRGRDNENNCIKYLDSSIEKEILFFIFPQSALTNLKDKSFTERIAEIKKESEKRFNRLKN